MFDAISFRYRTAEKNEITMKKAQNEPSKSKQKPKAEKVSHDTSTLANIPGQLSGLAIYIPASANAMGDGDNGTVINPAPCRSTFSVQRFWKVLQSSRTIGGYT